MDHTRLTLPATDLLHWLGTHKLPSLVDVTLPDDVAADRWRLPTARHVPHLHVRTLAKTWDLARPVVTICQKGRKLSQGAAAQLRAMGFAAWALAGGNQAWRAHGLPVLTLDHAPPCGTAWVLPATRDRRAALAAWVIWRLYDTRAHILWVPTDSVGDVADRFDAHAVPHDTPLSDAFAARGVTDRAVLAHIHAVDSGCISGTRWLDVLPNLHETDEELAKAALPVLDAAWVAHRETRGQEAA